MYELEFHDKDMESPEGVIFAPDPYDPIDTLLVSFREAVRLDNLPIPSQQRNLARGVRCRDPSSARELIRLHRGLIAAVAYPFKDFGMESSELLLAGSNALLLAAPAYNQESFGGFYDYTIGILEQTFCEAVGKKHGSPHDTPALFNSMNNVVRFIDNLREPTEAVSPPSDSTLRLVDRLTSQLRIINRARASQEIAAFGLVAETLLPLLHLPTDEIEKRMDLSPQRTKSAINQVTYTLGVRTRAEAARVAFEGGVHFDIQASPQIDELTLEERQIASRSAKSNEQIAVELELRKGKVARLRKSLMKKTQARTEIELSLIVLDGQLEPTKKEIEEAAPHRALKEFTPMQRQVLERLHLPPKTIAAELGTSEDKIYHKLAISRKIMGIDNTIAMALELNRRGLEYDILTPRCEFSQHLSAKDMKVVENLAYSTNRAIANITGHTPGRVENIVTHSKAKTGARSRVELALMMREFDTGKRRPVRNRQEKLADKLGVQSLDDCDIEAMMAKLSPNQRQSIRAYHLLDETAQKPPSWKQINQELGMVNGPAYAGVGIKRMRQMLEAEKELIDNKV
jgi:DNA-binding CsgD family transcriptional regulator